MCAFAAAIPIASLALAAVGTGVSAYGAMQSSKAGQAQASAQAKIASNNQKIAEWQAQDALERGGEADIEKRREYAQMRGAQRASFASRGVALDEGSPLNIINDTYIFEEIDTGRIRDNARREAWGLRTQGAGYAADAAMFRSAASGYSPFMAGGTSLLTGGSEVADRWLRYRDAGAFG